jgi:hypothetical protein
LEDCDRQCLEVIVPLHYLQSNEVRTQSGLHFKGQHKHYACSLFHSYCTYKTSKSKSNIYKNGSKEWFLYKSGTTNRNDKKLEKLIGCQEVKWLGTQISFRFKVGMYFSLQCWKCSCTDPFCEASWLRHKLLTPNINHWWIMCVERLKHSLLHNKCQHSAAAERL